MNGLFRRVLIANRGEIALRIIRACRELGVETVAVYSEADRDSLHVRFADRAFCVGPAPSTRSYLDIPNIMSAALLAGADAIHPGYGYLSERAEFADICETHGLTFIGPTADQISLLGDKSVAKETMLKAGVPVVPGSDGPVARQDDAVALARDMGYPVIVKASAGGGGKGMRVARNAEELARGYTLARTEAQAAFGSDEVYIEKFIERPRHIEVQILADNHGHVVHFGERECSIQRRHQKIIEEAPSPAVSERLRSQMGQAAVKGAAAVNYRNAGTMEFLLDEDGKFYFMEMNTRIQVEHPVTEMVYGVDLVKEQIRIAAEMELGYEQSQIQPISHAIECRLNAEDPDKKFIPSPGRIDFLHIPGGHGVRWDSHVYSGYVISPYYDPMFGKLICWGMDREEAILRMQSALREVDVRGIRTNVGLHQWILADSRFAGGDISTKYLEEALVERSAAHG